MPPTDDAAGRASRRRLLRSGGAALATGLTTSLAGCSLGIPPLSGQIDFGRIDAPGPATDDYENWVPAESRVEDDDGIDHVWHAQPRRLTESAFGPGCLPVGITTGRLDYFGVGYRTYERALTVTASAATVVTGDVDPSTVGDAVADTGYEERPGHRGYTVFGRSDLPRVVAVADGVLVYAQSGVDDPDAARQQVEAVVDAGEGRVPRHVDDDAAFAALVERAGSRPANWLGISAFGGLGAGSSDVLDALVTSSISWDFDGDAVYYVYDLVFPEGERAPERAIKRALRDQRRALESSLADVETDGRFARVELRLRKASVRDSTSGTGHPQITWGVAFDERDRTVTFRHEAGEAADAARLSVDDVAADAAPFDAFDTFGPGDSVTAPVDPTADSPSPRVVYTAPDGKSSMTLFSYDLPEGT